MRFADSQRAEKDDILLLLDELQRGEVDHLSLLQAGLKGEVECLHRFDERELLETYRALVEAYGMKVASEIVDAASKRAWKEFMRESLKIVK
jgi:hypothetical protein